MVARNLPIAGFTDERGSPHEPAPTAWASPCEPLGASWTEDAYERTVAMIVDGIRDAWPDAVYLDLHGAILPSTSTTGEGEPFGAVPRSSGPKVSFVEPDP